MTGEGLTALARDVQRALADRSVFKQGENIAAALVNVHDRSGKASARIDAARRYRTALRAEQLDVNVLSPAEKEACANARKTMRRVSTQLLSEEGKRHNLLTSTSLYEALAAAEQASKTIVNRCNQALEAEQLRLRPVDIGQPIPEVPGASTKLAPLKRHQLKLTAKVGLLYDNLLQLAPGEEARELLELRSAADEWKRLKGEIEEILRQQPPDVQRFVQAASSAVGAPLSLLTQAVIDWLERENATDNFVIRTIEG